MDFKKLFLSLTLVIFGLSFAVVSYAHGYTYWTSTSKVAFSSFRYSEPLNYNTGTNYSLVQRFDYHNNLLFATLRGETGYTPVNYSGSYLNSAPLSANADYKDWSVLGGIGIDPRLMDGLMQNQIYLSLSESNLTWMAGSIPGGYDENYNVKYFGLNYRNIYAVTPRFSTVIGLSFYKGIAGTALDSNYPLYNGEPAESIGQTLGGEWAYGLKAGLRYRINNDLSIVADINYNRIFFDMSNVNYYYYPGSGYTGLQEPSSNTYIGGLEIGLHIAF